MKVNTLTVKRIEIFEKEINSTNLQDFLGTLQTKLKDIKLNNKLSKKDYEKYIQSKQIIVLFRFLEIKLIKKGDKNLLEELRKNNIYTQVLECEKKIKNYNSSKEHSLESILQDKYALPKLDDISDDANTINQAQKELTEALQDNIKFTKQDQLKKFFYSVISADPITIAMMLETDKTFNTDFAKFYHSEPFKAITKTILIAAATACIACVLTPWLSGISVTSTVAALAIKTCISIATASPVAVVPPLVDKMFERNIKAGTQGQKDIMAKLDQINIDDELSENILKQEARSINKKEISFAKADIIGMI